MTSRDFAHWIQGYYEIMQARLGREADMSLDKDQVACIRRHLAMAFRHEIDPSHGGPEHQKALSDLHQGGGTTLSDLHQGGGTTLPAGFPPSVHMNC